jgi:hypothetical protein
MSTIVSEQEIQRTKRFELSLPTRVEVRIDSKFTWNEVTRMEDVSPFGAAFILKRPVKRGRVVLISAPMPRQLRCYDFLEPQYRVWCIVRRCIPVTMKSGDRGYAVGVAFLGKNPPASFMENPAMLYELSHCEEGGLWQLVEAAPIPDESDLPVSLRRQSRFAIPESLILELLDEHGNVAASEVSVTENLSLGGAAVFTSFRVERGSFLRVRSERLDMTIISVVRGQRTGADGIVRLHLEFIDHFFPLEGIE